MSRFAYGLWPDARTEPREEVQHRTRATGPDGVGHDLLVVNISASGLMARGELPYPAGTVLRVRLPVLGEVAAELRWTLGGRAGFHLARMIALPDFLAMLAAMRR
jgi:hypothetical protein